MDGEGSGLAESLSTLLTFMGLLLGVRVHVIPEMILSLEGLVTHCAGERPLSSMNTFMDLKIVSLRKFSGAKLANVPLLLMQFYFSDIVDTVIVFHDIVKKTEAVDHVKVFIGIVVMTYGRSHDGLGYCVLSVDVSPGLVSSTLIPATGAPGLYPLSGSNGVISLSANHNTGSQ